MPDENGIKADSEPQLLNYLDLVREINDRRISRLETENKELLEVIEDYKKLLKKKGKELKYAVKMMDRERKIHNDFVMESNKLTLLDKQLKVSLEIRINELERELSKQKECSVCGFMGCS